MKKHILMAVMSLILGSAHTQTIWTSETKLKGTIGKYEIVMTLAVPYGGATPCFTIGEYYYSSQKRTIDLCSEDDVKIVEMVDGKHTGYFIIKEWDKKVGQMVVGTWHSMDNAKSYPVTLKVVGKGQY
ncbi:MAG: hypothetical protein ACKO4K_08615 [Flavobacteriales bacterium]